MSFRAEDNKAVLSFPAPLDIAASLSFLSRNGDDYLDRWDGERWVRTLSTGSRNIPFSCRLLGTTDEPRLELRVEDVRDLAAVRVAANLSFLLPGRGFGALLRRDSVLTRLNRKFPGVRQVRQFDLFYGLLRAISAQQINLRWAATLRRRLAEACGEKLDVGNDFVYSLRPEVVAAVRVQDLRSLQFSTQKAESILAVAEALASGKLIQRELAEMEDADAMQALVALRGIGTWSAEWILVRCLGRARVVAGDLGVKKAVAIAYLGKETASEEEVRRAVRHWGAHATVAQAILLHAYAVNGLEKA
ncbi:MAG: DNA-3-methyladenine glycosylase 2 family protein [Deltaproteobacteria bacterium]|nr:MAG: DNA-3-methyladenine glycosylase 2 family protein [Deltaproteobacteria bacterium]